MSDINWGIIGCGNVTELKSGPAFNKISGSKLVAVMRRDGAKAANYAERHGVNKWYDDAEKLMNDPAINAVYIATPPVSHKAYAIKAIERGLHVYVEKPVTLDAEEAQQIADAVKKNNARLTIAHYRRELPMFLYIRELLAQNVIGSIRTVQIRMWQTREPAPVSGDRGNWRVQPELSGGGYFHDLAPHQLDLLLYYFGEPVQYQGFSLNQSGATPADDQVCGQILFKNNVVVNGSWCFNVARSENVDSCEIIGNSGKITFPFFGKQVSWKNEGDEQTIAFEHPQHIQQPLIERMVKYFKGEGTNPCSIDDAIVSMKIMDAFTGK